MHIAFHCWVFNCSDVSVLWNCELIDITFLYKRVFHEQPTVNNVAGVVLPFCVK